MIYTSYFAFIPKLPADMLKVSVSLFTPKWAKVDRYLSYLNPTEQLLREAKSEAVSSEEAMKKYRDEILGKLSQIKAYEDLVKMLEKSGKKDLALLCCEKPGEMCHRKFVAEWLENGASISVPEYMQRNKQLTLI